VTGIHKVTPRGRALGRAIGLILLDERFLLVALGLEQEAGGLVKAAPQTLKQPLGAAERVSDGEAGLNPLADLARTTEPARLDLGLQLLGLGRGQLAGIAPIVKGAESIQPVVAIETEPVANRPRADTKQVGDLGLGLAVVAPQHGGQTHDEAVVPCLLAATFDLLT
jgi:hypothetical protein